MLTLTTSAGNLYVESSGDLDIFAGAHRLFFVNILGLTPIDDPYGYVIKVGASTPKKVEDIQAYASKFAIQLTTDAASASLLKARQTATQQISDARSAGLHIKAHPGTQLEISEFQRALKPYQIPAVEHMLALPHAANFSVPGSGKTTMVLAAYAQLKADRKIDRLLVIGPRSCFVPWEDEFKECFGRAPTSLRFVGSKQERRQKGRLFATSDLALISYQSAANDSDELMELLQSERVMLVLDESHYIKRLSGGLWATTLRALAPLAAKRVILSGTPVPNGLEDLWSQMTFLWPNPPILGTQEKYLSRISSNPTTAHESIREELRPLYWRVRKKDVDLPVPKFHRIPVPLNQYQDAIYQALAIKVLADIEKRPSEREKLREWRKARMVRLLQVSSNPSLLIEHSPEFEIPPLNATGLSVANLVENYSKYEVPAKVEVVQSLIEKLLKQDDSVKVIVWTSFVHNITTLRHQLAHLNPCVIHGGVPKDATEDEEFNRENEIRKFKSSDKQFRLLIANPGACAESVSLHRVCKHAIYMDRTFNGAQYMQSLDRIHRLGLSKTDHVHYYIMVAPGTIDEVIDSRLEEKRSRLATLLEDDLQPVSLDNTDEFSTSTEEEADFESLVQQLRLKFATVGRP